MYIFSIFIILQGFLVYFSLGNGLLGFLKAGHDFTVTKKLNTPIFRRFNMLHTSTKPIKRTNRTEGHSRNVSNTAKAGLYLNAKSSYSLNKLNHYVDHLKNEGCNLLRYTQKIIMQQATTERRNLMTIYPVTKDYAAKIHEYYEFIKQMYKNTTIRRSRKKDIGFIPHGDIVIFNLLDKSCELLYRQQWQLINTTPMNTTQKYVTRIHFISKIINKQIEYWKKTEMQHICTYYQICKPYPAFTDHLEHLAIELLKLPDEKLKTFMYSLKQIIMNNQGFLAVMAEIKGKAITIKEIEDICNTATIKQSLTILRQVLHSKFKISSGKSGLRLQAAKVLFDIIDKAFQFNRHVNIDLEFEHFIAAIKGWNENKRPLDVLLVEQLINNILPKIFLIEHPAKSVLIETIIRGDTAQNMLTGKFIK